MILDEVAIHRAYAIYPAQSSKPINKRGGINVNLKSRFPAGGQAPASGPVHPTNKAPTKNAISGCENCDHKSWWEKPFCSMGKFSCEVTVGFQQRADKVGENTGNLVVDMLRGANDTLGPSMKFLIPMIIVGVVLVVVMVVKKR